MAKKADTLEDPALRMLKACVGEALQRLGKPRLSEEDLHGARKAIKQARAALRLLRSHAGEKFYRQENRTLRDAGRQLSPMRDAAVLAQAMASLRRNCCLQGPAAEAASQALNQEREEALRQSQPRSAVLRRSKRLLMEHLRRLDDVEQATLHSSPADLRGLYRRARKASLVALAAPDAANLHEWRKQSKYLRNALCAVEGVSHRRSARLARRLHALTDRLGNDHDLAVLTEKLEQLQLEPLGRAERKDFGRRIEERRNRLQRKALRQGRKTFRRKPRRFIKLVSDRGRHPG